MTKSKANAGTMKTETDARIDTLGEMLTRLYDRVSELELAPSRACQGDTMTSGPRIAGTTTPIAEKARAMLERHDMNKYACPQATAPIDIARLSLFNRAVKGEVGEWDESAARDPLMLIISNQVRIERRIDRMEDAIRLLVEALAQR